MTSKHKLLYMLLFVAMIIAACTPLKEKGYTINGTLEGAENEMLQVEMLSFPNMNAAPKVTVIDTVQADDKGNFTVNNIQSGPAILRIKSVQDPGYLIILSVYDEDVEVHANPNTTTTPEVSGSASTASFYDFFTTSGNYRNEIIKKRDQVQAMHAVGNDSLAAIAEVDFEAESKKYFDFIVQYADTAKSIANKIVALESLQYASQFDLIKEVSANIFLTDTTSVYAKELQSKNARYQAIMDAASANSFVGKQAPDIALRSPEGKEFKLSDLKGQLVLLDFWASWCGPCRKENPNVVKVYNMFKDKGFTIYSVSLDKNRDAWMRAIRSDGLAWPYHVSELLEWESTAAAAYNVSGIPASFLIDKNGLIISENLRGAALEKAVQEYIDKNK